MAEVLEKYLPSDRLVVMKIIIKALPPPLDPQQTDNDFGSFIFAPLGEYIVRYCGDKKYLRQSLLTLKQITMRFSMEDAMRTFINNHPAETLRAYDTWVNDKNYHVRRLVSESTRPNLPWSQKINIDYSVPIKYLDILYKDKTRYVTRSVANHLNDISKLDAELVIDTLKRWEKEGGQSQTEMSWIIKHATRTLVKRGDANALALLGFAHSTDVRIKKFSVSCESIDIVNGGVIELSLYISATADTSVLIDYGIGFVKASGERKVKIFKWKQIKIRSGEKIEIKKIHTLKADATTYKLYRGQHSVQVQINGVLKNERFIAVH
jgi:3-methyladenine DNA glycosylase AlkC